jgi:hypothetical protein
LTNREWIELERLAKKGHLKAPKRRGPELLEATRKEDEHPEWYEYPCYCRTCMSYADV